MTVSGVTLVGGPDGGGNDSGPNANAALGGLYGLKASHTSTRIVFNLPGGTSLTLTGTGFGGFDANGVPSQGTITGLKIMNNSELQSSWTNMSISAQAFWAAVTGAHNDDPTAVPEFLNQVFAGDDKFYSHSATNGGNDNFYGYGGNDTFHMEDSGPGSDVHGGDGNDSFFFGRAFDAQNGTTVDGGAGTDTLVLDGGGTNVYFGVPAYVPNFLPPLPNVVAHGLDLGPDGITNVEKINLMAGSSYGLIFDNNNVAPGQVLTINAAGLGASNSIYINGQNLNGGGALNVMGGAGADVLIGGTGNDVLKGGDGNNVFDLRMGGDDTAIGGSGDDTFYVGPTLTAADHISGGGGNDTVYLNGNYAAGVTFGSQTMTGIETLVLAGGGPNPHNYNLTLANATVAAGATLTIIAASTPPNVLSPTDTVTVDGHLVANGSLDFHGHLGNDTFIGGKGADTMNGGAGGTDTFTGGGGADHMFAGVGADTFVYTRVSDSTGSVYDTITGFDPAHDAIKLTSAITGIDPLVNHGSLSSASMDADLAAALSSSVLHAHHAVIFQPNSGSLIGHTFLIIDPTGIGGYVAGHDYVIELQSGTLNPVNTGLTTADFIM